jgi:NADH-quinone oxidoreductase subunit L
MDEMRYLAMFVVGAPLLAAITIGLLNKYISRDATNWLACGLMACSFVASLYILIGSLSGHFVTWDNTIYIWGQIGTLEIPVGFLIDRLTAVMITVVTFVSLTVHIYSIGYMHNDNGYQRFFCYISLFTFSMLMLVMANNFVQLFFGWEAVGLLSYLLIGFWYEKDSANFAALKAFLVNRIGDLGFILGIAAVYMYFNTLQYNTVFAQVPTFITQYPSSIMTFICVCLFIGAMAKSAQMPLHIWLPDSMEGPTPISALIHAATMVTAGVYMVARMSPLFEYSEVTLTLITIIGSITCVLMGILAVVQNDIKRIIAYSTLSQLGYMVVALGVSAYAAGLFHLITHAFFKALLFLGAGSVILAMHHEQDIFKMGNLKKYLPLTAAAMLVGTLAIIGFPGMSGFFSKDLIIEAVKNSSLPGANIAYYATLLGVFITSLYSFRLLFVAFMTQATMSDADREHLHESPSVIIVPLVLLAIPSIVIGALLINGVLDNFFQDAIFVLPEHNVIAEFRRQEYHGILHMFLHGFASWIFLLLVLGFISAWLCYMKYPSLPHRLQQHGKWLAKILGAKYGFDLLNETIIVPGTKKLGRFFWGTGDVRTIDAFVNGTASTIGKSAGALRSMQTGYLYQYIFIMIAGLVVCLIWTLYL